jgi:uncharacterized protein
MSAVAATFFWRRLDQPGHDACRLVALEAGWQLCGTAVFRQARRTCALRYDVMVDRAFRTRRASVTGWAGRDEVDLRVRAAAGRRWHVNGAPQPGLEGCFDIDLGFTPATNLLAIRRLALKVGEHAEAPAAWLAFPTLRLRTLPQRYERIARNEYAYQAPSVGYSGSLQVSRDGAVTHYPGLFEMVAAPLHGDVESGAPRSSQSFRSRKVQ